MQKHTVKMIYMCRSNVTYCYAYTVTHFNNLTYIHVNRETYQV